MNIKIKRDNLFLYFFFILILNICTSAKSEIVNKITVNGNDRISLETIILFSDVQIKQNITSNDLNGILKNLYETNFFEDVSVKIANNELVINVVEAPIIEIVEYNGIKANKIKDALNNIIKLKSRSSFNDFLISNDRKIIKEYLKNIGYYFSEVSTVVENVDNNLVKIVHNIDLGKKAK